MSFKNKNEIILNLKFVKKINERSLQQHPPTGGVHGATDDGDKTSVVATVKEEGGSWETRER